MSRRAAPLLLCAWIAAGPGPDAAVARNLAPEVAYVGDAACAGCHAREAGTYPFTAMGRSMSRPEDLVAGGRAVPGGSVTFDNPHSGRRYRIVAGPDWLEHHEIRLDTAGREAVVDRREISHVLGSGDRGQTFLVTQGDLLYQTAVAYRPHREGWGMAAGFEQRTAYDFLRPVAAPCLFCHANRARHVEGTLNEYRPPIFEGLAVGCERCHGPGALHVTERRSLPPSADGVDTSIVNPRRLPSPLREQVCFQCHLQGSARVVKAGRTPWEFRPGTPLTDVFAVFHAETTKDGFSVVSHVERLRESRCWTASQGKIDCLTCHDPHRTPSGEDAVRQFRTACLTCHTVASCALDAGARGASGHPEDCVRCHMAKLPPADAPHTLFTDHRIARRPASPAPPAHAPADAAPRLVNFMEGTDGTTRDLGLAYLIYASAEGIPSAAARGAEILEPWIARHPEDVNAARMLLNHYTAAGLEEKAGPVLENLAARVPRAPEYGVLRARRLAAEGRDAEALEAARAVSRTTPDYAPARLTLGDLLDAAGRFEEAETEHRAAARLDPMMAAAQGRLGEHARRRDDAAAARDHFERAILLNPGLTSARLGVARLSMDEGKPEDAIAQIDLALRADPSPAARFTLLLHRARALALAGRPDEAVALIDRLLAADPSHAAARALRDQIVRAPPR